MLCEALPIGCLISQSIHAFAIPYSLNLILLVCPPAFASFISSAENAALFTPFLSYSVCSDGKESAHNARDPGLIPWSGRYPGVGNDNSLQYAYLESSMDRGDWWATVHGVAKTGI